MLQRDISWYATYQWRPRRGAAAPLAWKIQGKLCFQGKLKLFKILKDKKYFDTVKNFRANSVFQGKRRMFPILNSEKYIFNTVNSEYMDHPSLSRRSERRRHFLYIQRNCEYRQCTTQELWHRRSPGQRFV